MKSISQIDDMTLAVLNCYRNNYYSEGNNTEQGIIANAINEVLPLLLSLKYEDYHTTCNVANEICDELEQYITDDCFITNADVARIYRKIREIKRRY